IPTLEALGRKHSLYGVRDEYYAVVGAALLSTLKELLGTKVFTPDTETAWAKMYGMVADVMKRAARQYSPETEYSQAEPVDQFAITQPLNDFPFAKPAIEPIEPLVQSYLQKLF
ncbi:MAG: globin domain-containing protein, partial [Pyrinomonadaceae bacterium]